MMRLGFVAAVLGLSAACGHEVNAPPTHSADINGDWLFRERLESGALALLCIDAARTHVTQTGATFTFTAQQYGFCRIGTDSAPVSRLQDVRNGVINGSQVTFGDANCSYRGTIATGDNAASGTVSCQLTLPSGPATVPGTWQAQRTDFTPPTVSATVGNGTVSHGDTLHVTVHATDKSQLALVGDSVAYDRALTNECPTDPPPGRDSTAASGTSAQHTFSHVVPACTGAIRVVAFASDTAGNRGTSKAQWVSFVLPVSQVSGSLDDTVYTLGDTVRIDMTAANSRGLGYVGYRGYNPNPAGQDSVAVTGTSVTRPFKLAIPRNAPVTQLSVRVFARHRLGWLTESDFLYARTTDAIRLAVQRLALSSTPHDMVYAAASGRIFLVDSTPAVREVVLSPFSLGTTYPLAVRGASLDVSPGEDSLLVALSGQMNVAVVRRSGAATVTVPITPPDLIDIWDVRRLRVAAGGRAMLGVGSGSAGHIVQLALSDRTQTVRQDWYGYGTFERSGDRSRILLIDDTSPVRSQLYLAATDTFLPHQSGVVAVYGTYGETSGDDAATKWLVSCQLLTADMTPIRTFTDPSLLIGPSALATDASNAYCGRTDGFLQFDLATGNRVRAVWLPSQPQYLKALPGGRVLAFSGPSLYLVTVP
jgi:hypothetical protein